MQLQIEPAEPRHDQVVEPLHRDPRVHRPGRDRRLQPRLTQPLGLRVAQLERVRLPAPVRGHEGRDQEPQPRHRPQLLPRHRGRALQHEAPPGRHRRAGPRRRALPPSDAVRVRGRPPAQQGHLRDHLLRRRRVVDRVRGGGRRLPVVRGLARVQGPAPVRPLERDPVGPVGLGRAQGEARHPRHAQLSPPRADADRVDRADPRQQRVDRAVHLEHVQPPRAGGRVRRGEQAPPPRPHRARPVDQRGAQPDDGGRWLGSEDRSDPGGSQGALQDGLGDQAAHLPRHGRRPRRVHLPEPVAQRTHGRADDGQAHQHALLRLEERAQDRYVLPPHAAQGGRDPVHGGPDHGGAVEEAAGGAGGGRGP
mmetsp:Transcript_58906/g.162847  ORF Transcript_58906/g.162847 Transcript_58906/m.162847 type:complete len:365 (+) Transcript_58906:1259-2353(+)